MILMPMRENDAEQIVATLLNESQIGKDQVDAGIAWIGKGKAQIYHDPFSLGSIEIDIHANLSRPAEGQEKQFIASFRSEEHTSELQSLMRISYAVFCLKKKKHSK